MLFKEGLKSLLKRPDQEVFFPHYLRIVEIWHGIQPLALPGYDKKTYWVPYCHHVAHAYAQAFEVDVVDGEKVHITQTRIGWFGHRIRARVSRYAHSWNVLPLPSGKRVILDIFPDETCSMLPIVVFDPHPAYTEPRDEVAKNTITKFMRDPTQKVRNALLVEEMLRIGKNP